MNLLSIYCVKYVLWMRSNLFVILNSKALALLEEFAETHDDVIDIDNCILYRCRKKFFPMLSRGWQIWDI